MSSYFFLSPNGQINYIFQIPLPAMKMTQRPFEQKCNRIIIISIIIIIFHQMMVVMMTSDGIVVELTRRVSVGDLF